MTLSSWQPHMLFIANIVLLGLKDYNTKSLTVCFPLSLQECQQYLSSSDLKVGGSLAGNQSGNRVAEDNTERAST